MPNRPPRYVPPRTAPDRTPTPRATTAERGYGARWQKARAAFLAQHPLCAQCAKENRVTAATVVDHVIPHKGDEALFWDQEGNWAALCAKCHNVKTSREGAFGRPVLPPPPAPPPAPLTPTTDQMA